MMNGLIAETDSLLKGILATMSENWSQAKVQFAADTLTNLLGLLIVVPSNPETSFF
jgi:hypothetical protein